MTPKIALILRELDRLADAVRNLDPITPEEANIIRKACRDVEWAAIDNFKPDEEF